MFIEPSILLWIILSLTLIGCTVWHIRENRSLSRQWHKDLDAFSANWLTRFAWSRTAQLLIVLITCMIIIIIYDWQLRAAKQRIGYGQRLSEASPSVVTALKVSPPPIIAPAANTDYYPPISAATAEVSSSPEPIELEPLSPEPSPALDDALAGSATDKKNTGPTIADVYNPEEDTTGDLSQMDSIKKRYESVLITYLFLKKCNKTSPDDYHVITSALAEEMASVNAPGRLQYDIQTAAQGSYKEVYSNTQCDTNGVEPLLTQYHDYINRLAKQTVIH